MPTNFRNLDDVFLYSRFAPPYFSPRLTYICLHHFQLNEVDEMQCWKTDECPVEDSSRFTKAWRVRSAEREPTMETHFDSEV